MSTYPSGSPGMPYPMYPTWVPGMFPVVPITAENLYPSYDNAPHMDQTLRNLQQAASGEHGAVRRYDQLAKMAPNEDFGRIIRGIREDEQRHLRRFSRLYMQRSGGRQPELAETAVPSTFASGIEQSIREELEDVEFYQRSAEMTRDLAVRDAFLRASWDEQRHASWFLYMWMKLNS